MAGYILKAATKSPLNKSSTERCKPHPGHSTPKSFLFMQGIIYLSPLTQKQNSNFCILAVAFRAENTIIFDFLTERKKFFVLWEVLR